MTRQELVEAFLNHPKAKDGTAKPKVTVKAVK